MAVRALPVVLGLLLCLPSLALAQTDGGPVVVAVRVDGIVTQGTTLRVEDALKEAERRGAPLLILLDTPGGLVDATLDIKEAVFNARVPVLTFVGPQRGAIAASAGTFLLLLGVPSGMAPGTHIGSAQPIEVDPQGGGSRNATSKVENFVVKEMEIIAERAGRNATLAVRFVTENLNMDATEALDAGIVDFVSDDVDAFLSAVDGRTSITAAGPAMLRTAGAQVVEDPPSLLARLIDLIGNPQVAFILFLVGLYGLIFGLASPGTYVPETIGAICLVLGLIGLGLFEFNIAAALLIGLAAIFFIADLFTPTHGVLTIAGVVALVLGVLFLPVEPLLPGGFVTTFRVIGVVAAVASGGVTLFAIGVAMRHRKTKPYDELVGASAVVRKTIEAGDVGGQVWFKGALWRAVAKETIQTGATVTVTGRQGLTLQVEPAGTAAEPANGPPAR